MITASLISSRHHSRRAIVALIILLAPALLAGTAAQQQYIISTYAGGSVPATPAPASRTPMEIPLGMAADAAGNVYVATTRGVVFRVAPDGTATVVAGNGRLGYSGDGGLATNAQLQRPSDVAVDGEGNLFIADATRVRKVSKDGIITTVAGNGTAASSGDGGPAVQAAMQPRAVAIDNSGNLLVIDDYRLVRRITPAGIVEPFAGTWRNEYSGDNGPATKAGLFGPRGLAVDAGGNVYIATATDQRVRKVSPSGIITTFAGNGTVGAAGDGGPAAAATLWSPSDVAVDAAGNVLIADEFARKVRRVSAAGVISTFAGTGHEGFSGDGGPALAAQLGAPVAVAVDKQGNVFILDATESEREPTRQHIRKVTPDGIIASIAGGVSGAHVGDGGPATSAYLDGPRGLALDAGGNLLIADSGTNTVRQVSRSGVIATIAGNGTPGYSGDNGPAVEAALDGPQDVAVDADGNVVILAGARIRRVASNGTITTVAGGGTTALVDSGMATDVILQGPWAVAVDGSGNIFVAEQNRVLRVTRDGKISRIAGTGYSGSTGDGGPATSATVGYVTDLAVDAAGNIFIADWMYDRIRKLSPDGIISTFAGSTKDDGTHATLGGSQAIALDGEGNLYVAGYEHCRVSKVTSSGQIEVIAGIGCLGYSGDSGPATTASMGRLAGIAVRDDGTVYATDIDNHAIRALAPSGAQALIGAVVDAASETVETVSPGKIVVIYGVGLGPAGLAQNAAAGGRIATETGGTSVFFDGVAAPVLYSSSTQVAAVVPYESTAATAQVAISYQGQRSPSVVVTGASSAPSVFTANQTGSGQATAINVGTGAVNDATHPAAIGSYVSLYATGEGLIAPAQDNGRITGSALSRPLLPVLVAIDGIQAEVQYAGTAPGLVAGAMQVNVKIPPGVRPGGYVPVVLQVGDASSRPGVWIAVSKE